MNVRFDKTFFFHHLRHPQRENFFYFVEGRLQFPCCCSPHPFLLLSLSPLVCVDDEDKRRGTKERSIHFGLLATMATPMADITV